MAAVKTVADTRTETAGPAFPLVRRRPGNRDRNQTVHAGGRVMLKPSGKAAVDHHLHPLDGQACFGEVRASGSVLFPGGLIRAAPEGCVSFFRIRAGPAEPRKGWPAPVPLFEEGLRRWGRISPPGTSSLFSLIPTCRCRVKYSSGIKGKLGSAQQLNPFSLCESCTPVRFQGIGSYPDVV